MFFFFFFVAAPLRTVCFPLLVGSLGIAAFNNLRLADSSTFHL